MIVKRQQARLLKSEMVNKSITNFLPRGIGFNLRLCRLSTTDIALSTEGNVVGRGIDCKRNLSMSAHIQRLAGISDCSHSHTTPLSSCALTNPATPTGASYTQIGKLRSKLRR